jgi:hypothetical protein
MNVLLASQQVFNENMNMKYNEEEVPDNLGGPGDMLPADVLKLVKELLEQLRRADKDRQGSKIEFVYVASGGQHVETQIKIEAHPGPPKPHPLTPSPTGEGERPRGGKLPEILATPEAMALWREAQEAGYVDANYQPLISRTQAALLADAMAERLGIKEKWKVFGDLWKRNNMRGDYTRAMNQRQSLGFQDKLKRLFSTDNEESTGKT